MTDALQAYIDAHSKSQAAGFFLTLILGPLGLFYSSWVAALVLILIAFATFASVIGPVICWVLSIFISFATVSAHNEKMKTAALLMQSKGPGQT